MSPLLAFTVVVFVGLIVTPLCFLIFVLGREFLAARRETRPARDHARFTDAMQKWETR